MITTTHDVRKRQLLSFGFIICGALLIFALWPLFCGTGVLRHWALVFTGIMMTLTLLAPALLAPVYRAWMAFGKLIAWVNTRIILGMLFYTLFLSFGAFLRLMGKNPMNYKRDPSAGTYRVRRQPRPASHMQHQF